MPPQKNAGNRGAKKDTGVSFKNQKFIRDLMSDLKEDGAVDDVYVGRVTKRLGNGRMEVFYIEDDRTKLITSLIRGSFRGRGKRSVWIDVGSFVAIASTGVGGSLAFEIVAVLTPSQAQEIGLDPRILNPETSVSETKDGFEFDHAEGNDEVDIENI